MAVTNIGSDSGSSEDEPCKCTRETKEDADRNRDAVNKCTCMNVSESFSGLSCP
ncbi:MAG: hypothetical protein JW924_00020 [Fusobacteriaceae bacterium]|nr:hypothetical protein [Fusobacteriaceae bacterium]